MLHHAGTIDSTYRGEIIVALVNQGNAVQQEETADSTLQENLMKSISNEIEKRSARLIDRVIPLSAINLSYVAITGYLLLMPKVSLLLKSSLTPLD